MHEIRIGTMVNSSNALQVIPRITEYGFESFNLFFWQTLGNTDLYRMSEELKKVLDGKDIVVSNLSIYGNPLEETEKSADTLAGWEKLIDNAHLFGTDLVTGFTGRISGRPINESLPRFKEVFGELARRAESKGVRLAFENCSMEGNWQSGGWNIAHNPAAWEMMFNELPMDNLGLEWEPCHQLVSLIDPLPQLRKWTNRIFHVHGKDATIAWDIIREYGKDGPKEYAWHRTPGFGDSNWTDIISILRQGNYKGNIDIEGWHDPVYRGELEMTGQVHALNYLKQCRGGAFIPNPV